MNRDVALYALGVGACASDAVDADELKYVYHKDGQKHIKVFLFYYVFLTTHIISPLTFAGIVNNSYLFVWAVSVAIH